MESDLAFVDAQLGDVTPTEVVDPPATAADVVDEPVVADEVVDEPVVDGEPTVEGDKVDEEPVVDADTDPDEDPLEDLSTAALNKKLDANPELKKALESDPATRNLVYTALRRAAKLEPYEQLFTNPETAKFTLDTANEMVEFDRMFRSESADDNTNFLRALQFNSYKRDDSGNVITGANGPVSTGAYERIMSTYRSYLWNEVDAMAKNAGDDELAEAVRIIREKVEHQAPAPGAQTQGNGQDDLPANVRADLQRLAEFERKDRESVQTSAQTFTKEINTEIGSKLEEEIKGIITRITERNKVAVSDYVKQNIVRDAVDAVKKNVGENVAYRNMLSTLMQTTGRNAEGRAKVVQFALGSIKQTLPKIVASTFSNATKGVIASNVTRQDKIDKQTGRKEARTSGGVRSQALPDIKQVIADATKAKGRPLSDMEIVDLQLAMK